MRLPHPIPSHPMGLSKSGVRNLFPDKGYLDIYNTICGACKIITLKIGMQYSVKHLTHSSLMPWQAQAQWFQGTHTALGQGAPHPWSQ